MNLAQRVQQLEDYVSELKHTFGLAEDIRWTRLGLSKMEGRLVGALEKAELLNKEAMMWALYDGGIDAYDRDPKILDVWVCKINRKLADHGVRIETVWGRGRRISADGKRILKSFGAEIAGPPSSQSPSGQPPVRLQPIGVA